MYTSRMALLEVIFFGGIFPEAAYRLRILPQGDMQDESTP